jgi:hypothetical protein
LEESPDDIYGKKYASLLAQKLQNNNPNTPQTKSEIPKVK